ncbi:2-keto-3-deoxygluconate permease [Zobellella aerophila]|uniref:2-keto-3-deoxygluconate permease 1 n=1 Tax=Zobellella aerophila TaxID=870480 RepID=A0ABP6VIU3_9GAMM
MFKLLAKIPGALMVVPLLLGALVNTLFPQVLDIGSFTTALFKNGAPVLIGLFFVCMGSQIKVKAALPALEKGLALLIGKYAAAVLVGLSVAFLTPDGTFWGLIPLAVIAAMGNSNGALYVALTSEFGNKTDKGAISVLSLNDGPFLTLIALGVAGLADFPLMALVAVVGPIVFGFILGNMSPTVRDFLGPGERLIIPFAAFALGSGINFSVLMSSGSAGVLLGVLTVVVSGGLAILAIYIWHLLRRHPKPTRNVISGACESTTAGNAIATPAAVAAVDPSFLAVQDAATVQVAAAVVVTAMVSPFLVMLVSKWQLKRGVFPALEDELYLSGEKEETPTAAIKPVTPAS